MPVGLAVIPVIISMLFIACATARAELKEVQMSSDYVQNKIDMRGKKITTYILYYAVAELKKMNTGDILGIATDKYKHIENDITVWSNNTGHLLDKIEHQDKYDLYYIKKGKEKSVKSRFALSISFDGLEDLISPLALALASALEGNDVHIIFQGPAVRVLQNGYKGNLSGISRLFSGIARSQMAEMGHIPPQDKVRQLKELGAHFYVCPVSMEVFKVKESELIFKDVTFATYSTFLDVMNKSDLAFFMQ